MSAAEVEGFLGAVLVVGALGYLSVRIRPRRRRAFSAAVVVPPPPPPGGPCPYCTRPAAGSALVVLDGEQWHPWCYRSAEVAAQELAQIWDRADIVVIP